MSLVRLSESATSSGEAFPPPPSVAASSSSSSVSRNGGSPTQGAIQSDHCYGLPYQDHNYGGPAIGAPSPVQVSGRPPYPFKVRYPAALRPTAAIAARNPNAANSEDGDPSESFPVIGGLELYANDEALQPDTAPPNSHLPPRHDGISVSSAYPSSGRVRQSSFSSTGSGSSPSGHYYARYLNEHSTPPGPTPGYSQHLVQIGGRTYVRQATGPPAELNGHHGFRSRADYIGINNPPVLIPPYGGRGRGGKRPGRPRVTQARASLAHQSGLVASAAPISTLSSLAAPGLDQPAQILGPAPMVAASKGGAGRPSGRGRGPRRRSNFNSG